MSITCAFILNQDFIDLFSLEKIDIFKNSSLKYWKNDAYNGDWKKYLITEHPRFGHKIIIGCIVAKLNSKKDIRVEGIFHLSEMH